MGGYLPLYILLTEMNKRWSGGDFEGAVALAKIAAPYLHGRAMTAQAPLALAGATDEELDEWGAGGAAAAAEDPA